MKKKLCNIPSMTLGKCDLDWGHTGELHSSCYDGFYAREYEKEHRRRQRQRKLKRVK